VTNVLVRGTGWTSGVPYYNGYSIPVGSELQLTTLPWANIDQIKVVFSEDVVIDKADLMLSGVNITTYNVSGGTFSYDAGAFTAAWTLPQAIGVDKLMVRLNADGADPVHDIAGNRLDGEWTNPPSTTPPPSTYPSGNGVAGGDFLFRFNVLPGDANQDGEVDGVDLDIWKLNVGSSGEGVTWGMADFNCDREVDGADVDVWKLNVGSSLGLLGLSTGGAGLSIGGAGLSIVPEPGTLALLEVSDIMAPAVDLPAPNIPPIPIMENTRPVANAQGRVNVAALTWANVQPIVGDLDRDAAGQGWFVDRTPTKDEEFRRHDDESQQRAVALRAFDRVDLLAAVANELGHVAGIRDIDRITDNLVTGSLKRGVRGQPALCEVDAVFAELALLDCQRVSWASEY
jgi:hypothetical protein